jgi:CRISPR-associated protein Cas5 subtype I-C
MSIKLKIKGDYACFTRPEMKVERVSYDVMTPSAARGVIEAIYWHPGLKWVIDKITVLNEIVFDSVRRNELKSKIPQKSPNDLHQHIAEDRTQRAALLLRNVAYIIDAHFDLVKEKMTEGDNVGKFLDMFNRRARKGQCYNQPYLGCREFSGFFEFVDPNSPPVKGFYSNSGEKDLGFMLLDIDYITKKSGEKEEYEFNPKFFRAVMKNGVITVPPMNGSEVRV